MTVFVLIRGYSEGDEVLGVYAVLEAAQRASPGTNSADLWKECQPSPSGVRYWTLQYEDVRIEEHEVRGE